MMNLNQSKAAGANDKAAQAGKEELARKLRRVASAPNAQGLFTKDGEREPDADQHTPPSSPPNGLVSSSTGNLLSPSDAIPERLRGQAFRRTYSSNSIKVRNVEVGPGSFDKIKLLGKGDVGKVYLVREKKSSRLYAMKGRSLTPKL
jgi:protein-serine/threonine kinase